MGQSSSHYSREEFFDWFDFTGMKGGNGVFRNDDGDESCLVKDITGIDISFADMVRFARAKQLSHTNIQ